MSLPVGQVQLPLVHWLEVPAQAAPHAPQWALVFCRSTQLPLHEVNPGLHRHEPL